MRSTAIASPTITIKVAIIANQAGNSGELYPTKTA